MTILKLYPTSNISLLFYIRRNFLYKRDTIEIADIYVSILVPINMLRYTCCHINKSNIIC